MASDPQSAIAGRHQEQSPFFRLPIELRELIYNAIFTTTRLSHGYRDAWGKYKALPILPIQNGLSLLRVCRRMSADIGKRWLTQVLFSFENVEAMLDKLSPLSIDTISAIRQIRVRGGSIISFNPCNDEGDYQLVHALKFLGGLKLDVLTVLAVSSKGGFPEINYDLLDNLVYFGQGYKELRFISQDSTMLGYATTIFSPEKPTRNPQPSHWAALMNHRDGAPNKPSVIIYRSTVFNTPGAVTDATKREIFQQQPPVDEEVIFAGQYYMDLMEPTRRELMIIVQRGKDIDYQVKPGSPFLPLGVRDLRRDFPNQTWVRIRDDHISMNAEAAARAFCAGFDIDFDPSDSGAHSDGSENEDYDPYEAVPESAGDGWDEKAAILEGKALRDSYRYVEDYVWDVPEFLSSASESL